MEKYLFVLRGPSGCGKSYICDNNLMRPYVLSKDSLRKLFHYETDIEGNKHISQLDNGNVEKLFDKLLKDRLQKDGIVIADATHYKMAHIRNYISLQEIFPELTIYVVDFSDDLNLDTLLENNAKKPKESRVPKEVIEHQLNVIQDNNKQLKLFEKPIFTGHCIKYKYFGRFFKTTLEQVQNKYDFSLDKKITTITNEIAFKQLAIYHFPILEQMINFDQENKYHPHNLWEHSYNVYNNKVVQDSGDEILKMAAIMHDIGKIYTKEKNKDEGYSYFNHPNWSVEMIKSHCLEVLKNAPYNYNNDEIEKLLRYVKLHDVTLKHNDNKDWFEQGLKTEKEIENLFRLKYADIIDHNQIGSLPEIKEKIVNKLKEFNVEV